MPTSRSVRAALVALLALAQGSAAGAQAAPPPAPRPTYTAADVRFMTGMIYHHAQAVLIAGWAPTHGASPSVLTLGDRIVVAQQDEIAYMQRWLRERGQPVPDLAAAHDMMPGMEPGTMMPGMLSASQLATLDAARGTAFDELFLTGMIHHHNGAITMVNQLFGAGAGEDETMYKYASDVYADQTTEIVRMQKMLASMLFGS